VRADVITIRLRKNGPYVIDAEDVRVIDWDGADYVIGRRPVALCRCGASSTKPFCDGTHGRIGFRADEGAECTRIGEDPEKNT
jgi:CDGSH-type Zn-finger protein